MRAIWKGHCIHSSRSLHARNTLRAIIFYHCFSLYEGSHAPYRATLKQFGPPIQLAERYNLVHTTDTSTGLDYGQNPAAQDMDDARSMSTVSSGTKRKRGALAFYAVRAGHKPSIYYSWEDVKEQTLGFKGPVFKKFTSLAEAEAFMKAESTPVAKPTKSKFYGVQAGHRPGVYSDWPTVLEQIKGFKGGKHKSFATYEEAQAYANGSKTTGGAASVAPISLNGHIESVATSVAEPRKTSKKQKKNNGSAVVPESNGYYELGTGPLPPDAVDGFDHTIKLDSNGTIVKKTEAEMNAQKVQTFRQFDGPLKIWTDGAAKSNGQAGAAAGIGIWFGPHDPRNVSEALAIGTKQTNQRAELTAISRAVDIAPIDRSAIIYTDSYYSIKCVTEWFQKWERNEWKSATGKAVENKDLIEPIIARIRERELAKASTLFEWVKGHSTNEGNIGADKLASDAARVSQAKGVKTEVVPPAEH